jgi:RNA polymerase sigma-70 factor, ECF subfamily
MSNREMHPVSRAEKPIGQLATGAMAETRAAVFTEARPLLFAIAYRMLASVADAEDLVQDAYLRWQQAPEDEIRAPRAYLTTIVTRLAINQLQSARHQRESYVGPWLPEPLVTEHAPDPSEPIELAESLSMAFMVMLERLSPIERAVLLLHDVFDFEYGEIARIVDKSESNCRQLLSRAKKHLGKAEIRFDADPAQVDRLMQRFTIAANAGDVDGMVALLAEDITLWTDGGGKARGAVLTPIHGAESVARFVAGAMRRYVGAERTTRPAQINGEPGFLVYVGGRAHVAVIFEVRGGRIQAIYSISNPDKLRTLPDLA